MLDPTDTAISVHEQSIAFAVINVLVRTVTEIEGVPASSKELHRVLSFMSAMVLETDTGLTSPGHIRLAGAYIGELVATFTKMLRDQHEKIGISAMDLAAASDSTNLH